MVRAFSLFTALAGLSSSALAYNHPGIPFTNADLAALKANLNTDPWKTGYADLQADGHSSASYTMQGPFATVSRNDAGLYTNEAQWKNDMQAIYNLSRMWYFTGNTVYAQNAHDILLAWANTQTAFTGIEASFDIGDYACRFVTGADILRGTWSGWTAADTTVTQNYFGKVLWPALGLPAVTTGSQGIEPLAAGVAIAVFNDDTTKFNQVLNAFITDADSGLRDTLANGEMGDTGRDQGHAELFLRQLAFIGEVFWKQGVDVFSLYDNRILAASEYSARFNLPGARPPFVALGAPFWGLFPTIGGSPRDVVASRMTSNTIYGAYVIRKGLTAPWTSSYRNDQSEDMDSFMYRKNADTSAATAPTVAALPPTASVTTGLTNADLNGCTPAGGGTYSNGTWTLAGGYGGQDPWSTGGCTVHFTYKSVTGDFVMITKVSSVTNVGNAGAKGGIMLRDTINGTAGNQAWIAIAPRPSYERGFIGWTSLPYGSNAASLSFSIQQMPYWVKMERVGNRIQTFTSPNGGDWSPAGTADYANMPSTVYVGLFGTSLMSNTASTATFTNVRLTGGNGAEAATPPPAPFSLLAAASDSQVQVRWNEAFGATSYNVKRSTSSGGAYATIASVSNTTYTDSAAANGTTYYYVVSAANPAGESANTAQDSATPQAGMINVCAGGTANANAGTSGVESCYQAFDANPASKWYTGSGFSTAWIQYDFGASLTQVIKSYAITSANDVPGRDPQNWQLQGSNDGLNWTVLDAQSTQSFAYRHQTKSYALSNSAAYRYYQLNITANNGATDGIQLSELAFSTNQGHTLPNGTYRLLNRKSGKALEVQNGSSANGALIDQWSYTGGNNQKWTLTDQGNGQYQLLGVASGKVADVSGASTANGASLDLWPWTGANNQQWTISPTGDGFFKLTAVHSGKVADVNGASTADGASVIQWPYGAGTNQQWSISTAP